MPGLNTLMAHQSLNANKNEKNEQKWRWPKWLKRQTSNSASKLSAVANLATPPKKLSNGQTSLPTQSLVQSNSDEYTHQDWNPEYMEAIVQDDLVCLLCLQIPNEWFTLETCSCRFCKQCMEMYVHCCITSGDVPISCPDGLCPGNQQGSTSKLSRKEIRHLVPNEIFHLYLRLQLNTEVASNPKLMWCPRPGCETVCQLTENISAKKHKFLGMISVNRRPRSQEVVCSSCQFSFCSQCKTPWHLNSPCPNLTLISSADPSKRLLDSNDPIAVLEKEGQIKRCPFCQVPIERDDGCAQMMCKNCRHVFCWFCLASLDDDFMLRHYDSGPCRSRLGHSRISVVWHRTQVVSAFLGLGVLFLVTSPLLLLVSPCFFCWRHHAHKGSSGKSNVDSSATVVASNSHEQL